MKETQRCSYCIIPTSLPSVSIDKNGVCNYCNRFIKLFGNQEVVDSKKKEELELIVRRVKELKRPYDCLIPLSGGKDSTNALYVFDKVYKLKCLCVTYDNGFMSNHARTNIKNAIKATNADHIIFNINYNLLLKLYKLFIIKCGNFCPVCMRGIEVATQIAFDRYTPPIVVSGAGRKVSYLSIIPELFQGGDVVFFKNVLKGEAILKDAKGLCYSPFSRQVNKAKRELFKFLGISNQMIGNYSYYMSIYDYVEASYDDIKNTIQREMGWTSPEGEFEHMDCLLHDVSIYMHTSKFPELTKTTLYHSNLIRLGRMTRDEAIDIEKENLKNRQEPRGLGTFLKKIEMRRDEFNASVRDWRKIDKFRDERKDVFRLLYRRIAGQW